MFKADYTGGNRQYEIFFRLRNKKIIVKIIFAQKKYSRSILDFSKEQMPYPNDMERFSSGQILNTVTQMIKYTFLLLTFLPTGFSISIQRVVLHIRFKYDRTIVYD